MSGRPIRKLPAAERLALGVRIIPEDRTREALILDWSVQENALLGLQRTQFASSGAVLDRRKERSLAAAVLERLDTKSPGPDSQMADLSGGNQQRFVAGRALHGQPSLLLAFQPTRGLDIRGTRDFYAEVRRACARGMGALVISFDLDELVQNCSRILVMFAGRLSTTPAGSENDRQAIGRLMVGLAP